MRMAEVGRYGLSRTANVGLVCRVRGRTDTRTRDKWASYSWASERRTRLADLDCGEKAIMTSLT